MSTIALTWHLKWAGADPENLHGGGQRGGGGGGGGGWLITVDISYNTLHKRMKHYSAKPSARKYCLAVQHYCKMLTIESNHKNAHCTRLRNVQQYHVCNAVSAFCRMQR